MVCRHFKVSLRAVGAETTLIFDFNAGYHSRTATIATDHSEFSQTHLSDTQLPPNLTELAAELIGPTKCSFGLNAKKNSRGNLFPFIQVAFNS